MSRLLLQVRDPGLKPVKGLALSAVESLSVMPRRNLLGGWAVKARGAAAEFLAAPGYGLLVYLDRRLVLSGSTQAVKFDQSADDPTGVWEIAGYDDAWVLADEPAYPNPTTTDLAAQQGTEGYDRRTGPLESLLYAYPAANIGPTAALARRHPLLDFAPDLGRGPVVTADARFEMLGPLSARLAGKTMVIRVRQHNRRLRYEVTIPQDRSKLVRFAVDNGSIRSLSYTYQAPDVTVPIVAGQGAGEERVFVTASDPAADEAAALWGRRPHRYIDQRQEADPAKLVEAAVEALTEGGTTKTGLTVELADTSKRFGTHYDLGDLVTVVVRGQEISEVVSEGRINYDSGVLRTGAVIGDLGTAARDPMLRALTDVRRRLSNIERT